METDLSRSTVGLKQSLKAVKSGIAEIAFVARDAEAHVQGPFVRACEQFKVPIEYFDTCKALGDACGIDVGAAIAVSVKQESE